MLHGLRKHRLALLGDDAVGQVLVVVWLVVVPALQDLILASSPAADFCHRRFRPLGLRLHVPVLPCPSTQGKQVHTLEDGGLRGCELGAVLDDLRSACLNMLLEEVLLSVDHTCTRSVSVVRCNLDADAVVVVVVQLGVVLLEEVVCGLAVRVVQAPAANVRYALHCLGA